MWWILLCGVIYLYSLVGIFVCTKVWGYIENSEEIDIGSESLYHVLSFIAWWLFLDELEKQPKKK